MGELNKVEVVISGKIITLISDESEEYIYRLANYIDKKTQEAANSKSAATIHPETRNLLICLNIADDYLKLKEKTEKNLDFSDRDELLKKIASLEAELVKAQRELDEYIEAFDADSDSNPIRKLVNK